MDNSKLELLKENLGKLSEADQDHIAAFLLMQRLKRNKLIMPSIHQRIDDASPDNWETLDKVKNTP